MPATIRGVVVGTNSGADVSVTLPAATQVGDLAVAFAAADYGFSSNLRPATAWTWTPRASGNDVETNALHHKAWTAPAEAAGATTLIFPNAASATADVGVVVVVLAAGTFDSNTPVEDAQVTYSTSSSTSHDPPAATSGGTDRLALAAAAVRTGTSYTPPTGYGELADVASRTYVTVSVASAAVGAGTVDPPVFTAAASAVWSASTLIIRPAPASISGERNESPSPRGLSGWSAGGTAGVATANGVAVADMEVPTAARGTQGSSAGNLRLASPFREYATDQGGKAFTARFQVRHSAARSVAMELVFRTATNAQTGTLTSGNVAIAANGTAVITFTGTAPAGTYRVQPTILVRNAGAGEVVHGTACRIVEGSFAALDHADGSSSGWAWDGTVGESTSGTSSRPAPRSNAIGQALEADTARPIARARRRDVGQALEGDTATSVGRSRRRTIGQAVDTSSATPIGRVRRLLLGQALEADTATPVAGRSRRRDVAQVVELDTASPVSPRRPGEARQARETDSALPVARTHRRDVGATLEGDQALPIGRARSRTLGQAVDTSTATPVVRSKRRDVGQALEVDSSLKLGRRHTLALGQALETDTAAGIAKRSRRRSFGQALEADTARPIARRHRRDLGQALEYDVAFQLEESAATVSDEAYGRAIAADDRVVFGTLRVDWRGDRFASPESALSDNLASLEIERSLDGDLPEGAGLIDGFATATLKAELGGRRRDATMTLAAELSPFRPDSPLAGVRKSMRTAEAEIGVVTEDGPRSDRLFSGPVRLIGIDEGSSSVSLDADDPSERMRALATLPTYGEFVTHANRRAWKLTTNSQAVVDFCARRNGIFASPPPRPEAIIVATGHGCLWAERGFNGAPISINGSGPAAGLWTEDGHPYGMLGTPESPTGGTVGYQEFYGITDGVKTPVRFEAGNGVGLSALLHVGSYMRFGSGENRVWQVRITEREYPRLFVNVRGDGALYAGLTTEAGAIYGTPWVTTGASRWRFVGVHFRWASNTSLVVTFRVDGQTRSYTVSVPAVTITPTPFFGGYRPILQVNAGLARAWSNLQVWPSATAPPAGPWQGETHVSQADIGRGNNELVYLPDRSAEESWKLLKEVTEAEYAVHGFSEYGRYYWRPRTDVRADRVDHVLDVEANLAEVGYSYGSDTIRNSVGVTTTAAYHSGALKTVVEAKDVDQFRVEAGTTKVFRFDWPHGAAGYQGGILPYHRQKDADPNAGLGVAGFAEWNGDVEHGWTYSSIGASGGFTIMDNTRSVVVRYVQTGARKVEIRVSNPGPGPIRLATAAKVGEPDSGEPAMKIGGWPLEKAVDRVTVWRNEDSIRELGGQDNGGERSFPIPSSDWRQDDAPLAPVARDLLAVLDRENPVLEDLPCRGDQRIRAGNVARGRFRDGAETIGTVVRTRHVLSVEDGRFRTLVSLRPLPAALQAPPTEAPGGWTFYVDISHHQGNRADSIDLGRVRDAGYAGCVARIGQGAGSYVKNGVTTTHGALIDTWWTRFRDEGVTVWPETFAGYWYVGSTEAPADQAARCAEAIGDPAIPIMLDWEDGAGSWQNLLNVLAAFRAAGLTVTMLYTNLQSYAGPNGASSIDSTGLALINSRYWLSSSSNPAQDPGAVWADVQATNPSFGFATAYGGTVDALQFTDAGTVYPGMNIDVNAFPGTPAQLAAMFHGETLPADSG